MGERRRGLEDPLMMMVLVLPLVLGMGRSGSRSRSFSFSGGARGLEDDDELVATVEASVEVDVLCDWDDIDARGTIGEAALGIFWRERSVAGFLGKDKSIIRGCDCLGEGAGSAGGAGVLVMTGRAPVSVLRFFWTLDRLDASESWSSSSCMSFFRLTLGAGGVSLSRPLSFSLSLSRSLSLSGLRSLSLSLSIDWVFSIGVEDTFLAIRIVAVVLGFLSFSTLDCAGAGDGFSFVGTDEDVPTDSFSLSLSRSRWLGRGRSADVGGLRRSKGVEFPDDVSCVAGGLGGRRPALAAAADPGSLLEGTGCVDTDLAGDVSSASFGLLLLSFEGIFALSSFICTSADFTVFVFGASNFALAFFSLISLDMTPRFASGFVTAVEDDDGTAVTVMGVLGREDPLPDAVDCVGMAKLVFLYRTFSHAECVSGTFKLLKAIRAARAMAVLSGSLSFHS